MANTKRTFIKFKKTFTHVEDTEHVNVRGPGRFTTSTLKIMKGSILEVYVDNECDDLVLINNIGCNHHPDDRIQVTKEYFEFY